MPQEDSALESSAPSKYEDIANYAVYPKDFKNKEQCRAITSLLKSIVSDPTKLYISATSDGTTYFWGVPLTPEDARKVEANSNVMTGLPSSKRLAY